MIRRPPRSPLFPSTTLSRSDDLASFAADALVRPATTRLDPTAAALRRVEIAGGEQFQNRIRLNRELAVGGAVVTAAGGDLDRKSTRLNSSHSQISYAVFCLK